jgi:hypothetical protein
VRRICFQRRVSKLTWFLSDYSSSQTHARCRGRPPLDCVEFWASSGDKDEQDACDPRPEDISPQPVPKLPATRLKTDMVLVGLLEQPNACSLPRPTSLQNLIHNSLQGGLPTKPSSVLRSLDIPTRIAKQHPRQLFSKLTWFLSDYSSSQTHARCRGRPLCRI